MKPQEAIKIHEQCIKLQEDIISNEKRLEGLRQELINEQGKSTIEAFLFTTEMGYNAEIDRIKEHIKELQVLNGEYICSLMN